MIIGGLISFLLGFCFYYAPIYDFAKSTKDEFLDGLVSNMTVPELGKLLSLSQEVQNVPGLSCFWPSLCLPAFNVLQPASLDDVLMIVSSF